MTGRLLDDETIATIRRAAIDGVSVTAISQALGISRDAVRRAIDDAGIHRQRHDQPDQRLAQPVGWMEDAACARTDPDLFVLEKGGRATDAKAVCAGCTVIDACLDYALVNNERGGVWGGKTEKERRNLKPRRAA
jgi:WhiB family redox-sensing transcriptional regulator